MNKKKLRKFKHTAVERTNKIFAQMRVLHNIFIFSYRGGKTAGHDTNFVTRRKRKFSDTTDMCKKFPCKRNWPEKQRALRRRGEKPPGKSTRKIYKENSTRDRSFVRVVVNFFRGMICY